MLPNRHMIAKKRRGIWIVRNMDERNTQPMTN
jgi:hypothetical protein